jgi:hypothetical protein
VFTLWRFHESRRSRGAALGAGRSVRNSNFSRLLAEVQPLNQCERLNIHRQLRNNINPIITTKPFWKRMDTVGVGFEKTRVKRLYPALSDLPCTRFLFALSECITLAMLRLKVCSWNSCISVPAFFSIHLPHPMAAVFAIGQ